MAASLNRTFYGIETAENVELPYIIVCLNRTFYGIETLTDMHTTRAEISLNRTFYGIETNEQRVSATHSRES